MMIGVLGGGQLGRMIASAGVALGHRFRAWDRGSNPPAAACAELVSAPFSARDALARFCDGLDLVTFEFENVPIDTVRAVAQRVEVRPGPRSIEVCQERLVEKRFLTEQCSIPVAPFRPVDTAGELDDASRAVGFPIVMKTRTLGYDGRGQMVVREPGAHNGALLDAWRALGGAPVLIEQLVAYDRELSLVGVRGHDGSFASYPLSENTHEDGILRATVAPAPNVSPALQQAAEDAVRAVAQRLGHVGAITVEFFEVGGKLIANEIAPRVHNSGHWTIEGAATSQFANHVRAITGMPLGDPSPHGASVMLNLIGAMPNPAAVLALPGAHLHDYAKSPRPGRKLGHVTVTGDDPAQVARRAEAVERAVFG